MNNAIIETRKVQDLKNWDKNPRSINEKDFERLKQQIIRLGVYKPLLINQDNIVLGGNMRLRAFISLGIEEVGCSVVSTQNEGEMLEYALSDNDRAGDYNDQDLSELLTLNPIDMNLYHVDIGRSMSVKDVLSQFAEIEEDDPPELDEVNEPISKLGEVYQLGQHRLMCGDSTKIEDVEKLMNGQKADLIITDPPYGVSYIGKTVEALTIDNDNKTPPEMKDFWVKSFSNMNTVVKDGACYYCCTSQGGEMMMMMMMIALMESGFLVKQQIIWVKNSMVLGHSDYQYKHEPLFYGWKKGGSHIFYGDRTQVSVWDINRPTASKEHPTMKPIALFEKPINNSSKGGDIIIDLFGGSGSTLIACEQLNRVCYMMELDPKYCDVIRKRYSKFIGKDDEWQTLTQAVDLQ